MATAPGHRLGQIIGDALELALEPVLQQFADEHGLYLDREGIRPARKGKRVTWTDTLGNRHNLDFVLERGGTPEQIGTPALFVESAWRRYTKHSKNKAGEIQGALLPLIETFAHAKPLGAAIVGGQWSLGALDQMRSLGFALVYIPYGDVVSAFASIGIDVATEEDTPDDHLQAEVDRYDALGQAKRSVLAEALRACAPAQFRLFRSVLEEAVVRKIDRIVLLPLSGPTIDCSSLADAIGAIGNFTPTTAAGRFVRWEVSVRFTNLDQIDGRFANGADAVAFLRTFV